MPENYPIILASASESRLRLLKDIDIFPAKVISTDVDETPLKKEKPRLYCNRVAKAKFEAATKMLSDKNSILITADTISVCGTRLLNKPVSDAQVRSHIELLSGRRHAVYTSVFCGMINAKTIVRILNRTVRTIVTFKRMNNDEIDYIVASGQGIGRCGGCQIAKLGGRYVKYVSGSFSNVIGLPLYDVSQMLYSLGYNLNQR